MSIFNENRILLGIKSNRPMRKTGWSLTCIRIGFKYVTNLSNFEYLELCNENRNCRNIILKYPLKQFPNHILTQEGVSLTP